jgi:diguanylate cyclase (GGDEF)-like protein
MQQIYNNIIFNAINMGIIVIDSDEKVLLWNNWIARHSGINEKQALGLNIVKAFATPPSSAFLTALRNTIKYNLPAVLSNALHRSPLPLFNIGSQHPNKPPINQSITITPLQVANDQRCFLIQVTDSSTSIKREKMLLSHSETLKRDATTDSLTGIYNRRFFDEHYKISLGQAIRQKLPLSLFMIDIDYFKQYNDHYGHPAGDKILIKVAAALKSKIARSSDMLARYGGEEFVMVLPNMNENNSLQFAEKLIAAVSSLALPHVQSKDGANISISVGVSTYNPTKHREASSLVIAADTALYKAKQNGRNTASFMALDTIISHRNENLLSDLNS